MESKRKIRKQIYLEPNQYIQIKKLSESKDITESEIIRVAINHYLSENVEPLNKLIGLVKDGNKQGSTTHDHDIYLSDKDYTSNKE